MILTVILGCEIAFWLAVALGLAARYVLRRPRLGMALLATVPLIDVILLVAVAIHLRGGGVASVEHSLATFYLGFSLAYGHRMIAWADTRFARRFAGGPAPVRLAGAEYTRRCWGDVVRTGLACVLAVVISAGLIAWIDDAARTQELASTYAWAGFIVTIETVAAISYTIWPRRPVAGAVSATG